MKLVLCFAIAALCLLCAGCSANGKQPDLQAEAPPAPTIEREPDAGLVKVDHAERFPLTTAEARSAASELHVTGSVAADVSRNVPVVSLASGRVVEIRARLGDTVAKGQLLMRVQSADLAAAFADYRHARADETLSDAQLERSRLLFEKGAVARKDMEIAQDAAEKAKVDVETARDRLRLLGADVDHPSPIIDILAPASGVITEQNVTAAAGVKTLDNSPNLFTISDLSDVWLICDVYENDLPKIHLNESAEIRLNAYPDKVWNARIANIGPILDPNLRTAKVRLEMHNPGHIRLGMFVTAVFHGQDRQTRAVVPSSAILHLHDRDWVYVPESEGAFRRVEVAGGKMVPPDLQEVAAGLKPGDRVVSNALVLQNASEQ
jgi:cobalt-zinc-cadmium efflux system membrane fusion protein